LPVFFNRIFCEPINWNQHDIAEQLPDFYDRILIHKPPPPVGCDGRACVLFCCGAIATAKRRWQASTRSRQFYPAYEVLNQWQRKNETVISHFAFPFFFFRLLFKHDPFEL